MSRCSDVLMFSCSDVSTSQCNHYDVKDLKEISNSRFLFSSFLRNLFTYKNLASNFQIRRKSRWLAKKEQMASHLQRKD